jgi:hypothetical protein
MSGDIFRAFVWHCMAFEASLSVLNLKRAVDAIKAWHRFLALLPPAEGQGDYKRLTRSLACF